MKYLRVQVYHKAREKLGNLKFMWTSCTFAQVVNVVKLFFIAFSYLEILEMQKQKLQINFLSYH
jgi:hypothetical protein